MDRRKELFLQETCASKDLPPWEASSAVENVLLKTSDNLSS